MAFEKYLSNQGKSKRAITTPLQDISAAARVREEVYGGDCCPMAINPKDWERLDAAYRREHEAQEFLRTGTLEKE